MATHLSNIPKGTRDFPPDIMVKRNYIFNSIREVFCLFGFMPLETPSVEYLSTLMGKYGEEGDKLLFKILNNGDFLSDVPKEDIAAGDSHKISSYISEKALRYDLTVPFARFVAQNAGSLTFPFKRYQIQPVWRADRPQKGRYREFFQCDADTVGSDSLLSELEFLQIIDMVFKKLNINVCIKINNRKLLSGIAEHIGAEDKFTDMTTAIDKIEKAGFEKVSRELSERGLSDKQINTIKQILSIQGDNKTKTEILKQSIQGSVTGAKGIEEMETLLGLISKHSFTNDIEFDISLARGLNYYTGTILEVKPLDVEIGSICAGGRYDNLTGSFGLQGVSGAGISFGADRIYDVLTGTNGFSDIIEGTARALFVNFGDAETEHCLKIITDLREKGISCEMYPEPVKLKKQLHYADVKNIPYAVMIGADEIAQNLVTIKDLRTGEQKQLTPRELAAILS